MKMPVEAENAKQEAREIVERCIKCGMCNSLCPVLKVMREEQCSPRGKAIILDKGFFEKNVYDCTLCKNCESLCPKEIKLSDAFIKARQVLVGQKKEFPENKEMIKNLEKTGNIYGIKEE
ncbi:4Fe-4S dicluster domain-containing protein [Candidatus Pacearchaeota archaeon]|nr:4Fe-4S dicluster domain-containing protein [Candidatus Pacearchaeota archaeon]MBD3283013.1 4Fe-4S dicluster domain-containing protein [Candidatus Pacearchaeota archaeon]